MGAQEAGGRKTPLYQKHVDLGARMIDFAGWIMPVEYEGIIVEHKTVRNKAGLFDLSHMGEVIISGDGAGRFLDYVFTRKISTLAPGEIAYSPMCLPDGGIIDDIVIYRRAADYMLVVNAANREKDVAWLQGQAAAWKQAHGEEVTVDDQSDAIALLAVQGPESQAIVQKLTDADLSAVASFRSVDTTVAGVSALVSRTGYTGEDGFEIYIDAADAPALWDTLLAEGKEHGLVPVGLGARDTLRLEARLPLYGNDIDETTNPLEAGLRWTVDFDKGDFIGRDALMKVRDEGVTRRLIGFEMVDRGIPRKGYPLRAAAEGDEAGDVIGYVTSGTHSPSLDRPIGLGYVEAAYARAGTAVFVDVRGRMRRAQVIKGRFIPS